MSDQQPLLSGFAPITVVAAELGVHTRTLKRWKTLNYGPPAVRIGKRVFYRRADIASWLADLGQVKTKRRTTNP